MKERFFEWYAQNKGLFWGMLIGLIVAILFMTIGFGYTLLIAVCVGVGAFFGARPDIRKAIGAYFTNLFGGLFGRKNEEE